MDNGYNIDEVARRLKPALDFYRSLDYSAKGKLFGTTASSDIDNILALAVLMHDGKVMPQINLDELAKRIEVGVVPEIDLEKLADAVAERLEEKLSQSSENLPYAVVSTNWVFESEGLVQETNDILTYLREEYGWQAKNSDDLKVSEESLGKNDSGDYSFVIYKKGDCFLKLNIFPKGNSEEDDIPYIEIMFKEKYNNFERGINHLGEDNFEPATRKKLLELAIALDKKFNQEFDPENTYDEDSIDLTESFNGVEIEEE